MLKNVPVLLVCCILLLTGKVEAISWLRSFTRMANLDLLSHWSSRRWLNWFIIISITHWLTTTIRWTLHWSFLYQDSSRLVLQSDVMEEMLVLFELDILIFRHCISRVFIRILIRILLIAVWLICHHYRWIVQGMLLKRDILSSFYISVVFVVKYSQT